MVGAPGVGCDELRLRLIGNKAHYASPIPHTTRSPKQAEINGRDLVFVTRPEMERKSSKSKLSLPPLIMMNLPEIDFNF